MTDIVRVAKWSERAYAVRGSCASISSFIGRKISRKRDFMQLEETIPNIKQGFWIFTLMWLLQNSTAYKFAYTFSLHITSPKINQLSPSTCLTQKWWWWWWGVLGMVHTCARERSQRYAQAQLWWHRQQINELFTPVKIFSGLPDLLKILPGCCNR